MIKGIDISHNNAIDLSKLSQEIVFVYCKATQGATFKDDKFNDYWQQLKKTTLLRGAYHFLNASDSAASQAANFLSRGIDFSKENVLPPVLDVEDQVPDSLNSLITKDKAAFIQKVTDWINIVEKATGRKVIIYSYRAFFSDYLNNHVWPDNKLWLASVNGKQPGVPKGWSEWTIWQNSWYGKPDGSLKGGNLDMDLFNGTVEQMKLL